jgi:hypothetical protein
VPEPIYCLPMANKDAKRARAVARRAQAARGRTRRAPASGTPATKTSARKPPADTRKSDAPPEPQGANRIRLLARDPGWIFAYWRIDPAAVRRLGEHLGERSIALSRLTLRIVDPRRGTSDDIPLPPGARWWYLRTDGVRRLYRAQLGVTLPSGEFRRLAESDAVVAGGKGA